MSTQTIKVIPLPSNVVHWNTHFKDVRAFLSQCKTGLSISVPAPVASATPAEASAGKDSPKGSGKKTTGVQVQFEGSSKVPLTTELLWQYDFCRPEWFGLHDWNHLQTMLFSSLFLGISHEYKWLTHTVKFGDGKGLLDALMNLVGSKDVQKQRIKKELAENVLLSMAHYPCWYGTFRDLYSKPISVVYYTPLEIS